MIAAYRNPRADPRSRRPACRIPCSRRWQPAAGPSCPATLGRRRWRQDDAAYCCLLWLISVYHGSLRLIAAYCGCGGRRQWRQDDAAYCCLLWLISVYHGSLRLIAAYCGCCGRPTSGGHRDDIPSRPPPSLPPAQRRQRDGHERNEASWMQQDFTNEDAWGIHATCPKTPPRDLPPMYKSYHLNSIKRSSSMPCEEFDSGPRDFPL